MILSRKPWQCAAKICCSFHDHGQIKRTEIDGRVLCGRTRIINTNLHFSSHQIRCGFRPRYCSQLRLECEIPNTCPRDELYSMGGGAAKLSNVPFSYGIVRVSEGTPELMAMTTHDIGLYGTNTRNGRTFTASLIPSLPLASCTSAINSIAAGHGNCAPSDGGGFSRSRTQSTSSSTASTTYHSTKAACVE